MGGVGAANSRGSGENRRRMDRMGMSREKEPSSAWKAAARYRNGDKRKSRMRLRVVMSSDEERAGTRHADEDEGAVSGAVGLSKGSK
jgi:hypothetical protein